MLRVVKNSSMADLEFSEADEAVGVGMDDVWEAAVVAAAAGRSAAAALGRHWSFSVPHA